MNLSEVKFSQLVGELGNKAGLLANKHKRITGTVGGGLIGGGLATGSYVLKRAKLRADLDACETRECRDIIRRQLGELKSSAFANTASATGIGAGLGYTGAAALIGQNNKAKKIAADTKAKEDAIAAQTDAVKKLEADKIVLNAKIAADAKAAAEAKAATDAATAAKLKADADTVQATRTRAENRAALQIKLNQLRKETKPTLQFGPLPNMNPYDPATVPRTKKVLNNVGPSDDGNIFTPMTPSLIPAGISSPNTPRPTTPNVLSINTLGSKISNLVPESLKKKLASKDVGIGKPGATTPYG